MEQPTLSALRHRSTQFSSRESSRVMSKLARLTSLKRFAAVLIASLLCLPAGATWSIVAVNRATGEVCVAGATCLNLSLNRYLPVIVVGRGGAAAQSLIDIDGSSLFVIHDGLTADLSPTEILSLLEAQDNQHQTRQYGIVSFSGDPVSFTGAAAGKAKLSITGNVGDIYYAMQGNVLTGDAVIEAAEMAFLNTDGDLSQRAMAGMEAARQFGGDGRCSCSLIDPTSCGSPPPSFSKTAESSFILYSRLGDPNGDCLPPGPPPGGGCARGRYYMRLRDKGVNGDSVLRLETMYDEWRETLPGLPDHFASEVSLSEPQLLADGKSRTRVTVRLKDLNGERIPQGGEAMRVRWTGKGLPTARPGRITDHGDGSYSFDLTATEHAGRGRWVIRMPQEENRVIQLFPPLSVGTVPLTRETSGR